MPPLTLLYLLFLVGFVFGAVRVHRLIVASRKAAQWPNTLYQWSSIPLPSWRYEPIAVTAILIHALSVLCLGFLALRAASNPGILSIPILASDTTIRVLVWFIQCGSILVVSNQVGSILMTSLMVVFRKELIALAITESGIGFGQYFLPWRWFSHFTVDNEAGLIRKYSVFAPDMPSLTFGMPDQPALVELKELLSRFLPLHPPEVKRAWYHTQRLLIPTMILVCLLIIVLAWLASYLPLELSLFVMTLLTTLLVFAGGVVLNKFAFGVLIRVPAKV